MDTDRSRKSQAYSIYQKNAFLRIGLIILCNFFFLMISADRGDAQFDMTFKNQPGGDFINCSRGESAAKCGIGSTSGNAPYDQTPFLIEYVNIGGVDYVHQIVGMPGNGFAQETYIKRTVNTFSYTNGVTEYLPDAGGGRGRQHGLSNCSAGSWTGYMCASNNIDPLGLTNWQDNQEMWCMTITGFGFTICEPPAYWEPLYTTYEDFLTGCSSSDNTCWQGFEPISYSSGNSTGNPESVAMRMILGEDSNDWTWNGSDWVCNGGEFCEEFLKDSLSAKPKITQEINDTVQNMSNTFIIDMSGVNYNTDTTPGVITNILTIDGATNFDFSTDVQASNVSGGRYTFTPGNGWEISRAQLCDDLNTYCYDAGTYSYRGDATFDHENQDWMLYRNPFENYCKQYSDGTCASPPQDASIQPWN